MNEHHDTLNLCMKNLKEEKQQATSVQQNDVNAQLLICMQGIASKLAPPNPLSPPENLTNLDTDVALV